MSTGFRTQKRKEKKSSSVPSVALRTPDVPPATCIVDVSGESLARLAKACALIGEGFTLAAAVLLGEANGLRQVLGVLQSNDAAELSEEAFVDQRSVLVPKDIFLRLAREGAFPSRKVGKRVVARWGDVKAALQKDSHNGDAGGVAPPRPAQDTSDRLDNLRSIIGLRQKGA